MAVGVYRHLFYVIKSELTRGEGEVLRYTIPWALAAGVLVGIAGVILFLL